MSEKLLFLQHLISAHIKWTFDNRHANDSDTPRSDGEGTRTQVEVSRLLDEILFENSAEIPQMLDSSVKYHNFNEELFEDSRASIWCWLCNELLADSNHEFMDTWYDTNLGSMCFKCFNQYVGILERAIYSKPGEPYEKPQCVYWASQPLILL